MLADGQGAAIVNVASTLGLRGSPFGSPYSASSSPERASRQGGLRAR
jgi:hypothetical protein